MRLRQPDRRSCGAASLVMARRLVHARYAGLVTDRAVGTRRVYRLSPEGLGALRDQLDTFWQRALDGYQDVAEPDVTARPTQEQS